MIYTSYFGHIRHHETDELRLVSIALHNPSGWDQDAVAFALRPLPFMLLQYKAGSLLPAGYELRYRECVLQNIFPEWVAKYYDECILLCYEKPGDFCHRHIVRKWLREGGVECAELDTPDADCWDGETPAFVKFENERHEKVKREGAQLSLF